MGYLAYTCPSRLALSFLETVAGYSDCWTGSTLPHHLGYHVRAMTLCNFPLPISSTNRPTRGVKITRVLRTLASLPTVLVMIVSIILSQVLPSGFP